MFQEKQTAFAREVGKGQGSCRRREEREIQRGKKETNHIGLQKQGFTILSVRITWGTSNKQTDVQAPSQTN